MQQQIKQLRINIDGVAQLVKGLKPTSGLIIDIAKIPEEYGIDLEKFMYYYQKQGWAFVKDNEEGNAVKSISLNKEIEKCYDSLILAKAWLGKILGELGSETPYKNDGNRKTVEDIEPTADRTYTNYSEKLVEQNLNWKDLNHIEKVDWLREEIQNLIKNTTDFSQEYPTIEIEQGFVYKYLCEARFWLGFELQRLKEESDRLKQYETKSE